MSVYPVLSSGSLQRIIKSKDSTTGLKAEQPLVQILGSKRVTNGSIRCILWDGLMSFKTGLIRKSAENEQKYSNGEMDAYSVLRLDGYWLSTLANSNDLEVLVISDFTCVMRGSQINRKLEDKTGISTSAGVGATNAVTPLNAYTSRPQQISDENTSFNTGFNQTFGSNAFGGDSMMESTDTSLIDTSKLCPITAITPFFNTWLIRARVSSKTPIRTYSGKKGEGRVFSFDARDDTSEIRVTAFNAECDKWFGYVEKDMNYYITKGNVKTANKKYSNLKSDYEITLTRDSHIEICNESIPVPKLRYNFQFTIKQLEGQNSGVSVDVLGVIRAVDDLSTVVSKKNEKEYIKRDIILLDKSLAEVRLTVWGDEAVDFNGKAGQLMAVKNAVVGEYRGKTLGCIPSSTIELDPDIPEGAILIGWYDRELKSGGAGLKNVIPLSKPMDVSNSNEMKYLCQINQKSIPEGQTVYYNCKATIMATNRPDRHLYKSCGKNKCMKKVREENGFYFCDKCNTHSPQFEWRLMLSICVSDTTGDQWLTAFQDIAEKLLGKTSAELSQIYDSDPNEYQSILSAINFKSFIFRIGSKVDEYNNERRVKSTCFGATPVDPIQRSKYLLELLNKLSI